MAIINNDALIEYTITNTIASFVKEATDSEVEICDVYSGGSRPEGQYITIQINNIDETGEAEVQGISSTGLRTIKQTFLAQVEFTCYRATTPEVVSDVFYPAVSPFSRLAQIRRYLQLPMTRNDKLTTLSGSYVGFMSLGSVVDRSTVMDDISTEFRAAFNAIINYAITYTEQVDYVDSFVIGNTTITATTDPTTGVVTVTTTVDPTSTDKLLEIQENKGSDSVNTVSV